jgi:hypothetical protein
MLLGVGAARRHYWIRATAFAQCGLMHELRDGTIIK